MSGMRVGVAAQRSVFKHGQKKKKKSFVLLQPGLFQSSASLARFVQIWSSKVIQVHRPGRSLSPCSPLLSIPRPPPPPPRSGRGSLLLSLDAKNVEGGVVGGTTDCPTSPGGCISPSPSVLKPNFLFFENIYFWRCPFPAPHAPAVKGRLGHSWDLHLPKEICNSFQKRPRNEASRISGSFTSKQQTGCWVHKNPVKHPVGFRKLSLETAQPPPPGGYEWRWRGGASSGGTPFTRDSSSPANV